MKDTLVGQIATAHALEMMDAEEIVADGRITPDEEIKAVQLLASFRPRQKALEHASQSLKAARQIECCGYEGYEEVVDKNLRRDIQEHEEVWGKREARDSESQAA